MAPPAAAKRIKDWLYNYDCHLWRDGKPVSSIEIAHFDVIATCDDAGHWYGHVDDERRWDEPVPKLEFDAKEILGLVQRVKASAPSAPVIGLSNPPGKSPAKKWPWLAAVEYGRRLERGVKPTAADLCTWCSETLSVTVDERAMRRLIERISKP
jgi:hypothetical protein